MNEEKNNRIPEGESAVKKLGMVKKQKIMIIAFTVLFAVLILLYFLVIRPIYKDKTTVPPQEPPTLLDGEAYGDTGYNIVVFPHIEMNSIKTVKVKNSYGEYTFIKAKDDEFYIAEHPQAPIGAEAATSFAVDAGYLVASRRVVDSCEDFSKYGLSESDDPATYTLTTVNDVKYTVYIGDMIPSGGGYYCRYEGRSAVYVVSSQLSSTVLAPATSMMSPLITYPMSQNAYLKIDNFIMRKNGESFLYIKYDQQKADESASNQNIQSVYDMVYPGSYLVNDDNYSGIVLASFTTFQGDRVLAAGTLEEPLRLNEKLMAEYGFSDLENIPYEIMYNYNKENEDGTTELDTALVMFAPSGVDGYYFAYSYEYDIIVLVSEDTVPYLEWDLLQYVSSAIYSKSILEVKNISVKADLRYNLPGASSSSIFKINESFDFKYVEKSNGNKDLECYAHSTGKTITGTQMSTNPIQSFYGSLLGIEIEGYAKEDDVDVSTLAEYACITVTYNDGKQNVYRFYRYGNRCVYTLDGDSEFYVTLTSLDKVIIDAVNAAWGEAVDTHEEYPKLNTNYLEDYANKNEQD